MQPRLTVLALALGLGSASAAATAGCATTPPSMLALPGAKERDGVRVEVTSIIGTWTRPLGFAGTVENLTPDPVPRVWLRLEGLGYQGSTIGRATSELLDLGPGETRRFRALFSLPTPRGLQLVTIAELRVRPSVKEAAVP